MTITELDIEVCRTIAVRYGLPLQFVVKEFHIMDAIGLIANFSSTKPESLVFKGGTALNKVYLGKMQRFSEDADFDLVGRGASQNAVRFCKELASSMSGYKVEEFRKVHDTVQFYCKYESPIGTDHIRIDISPKRLKTARPISSKTAASEFAHSSVSGLMVYSIEDLTARKLNALATRSEGKDLYDCYAALPLCKTNELIKAINQMLKSEGTGSSNKEFIGKALERLRKGDPKRLRNLTNPFIPVSLRPKSWEELKNSLMLKLEELDG